MHKTDDKACKTLNNIGYWLLLFTIFFAPLPLGSNRPWAWSILEVLIFLVALLTLWGLTFEKIYLAAQRVKLLLIPLALVQLYVLFQTLPILHGDAISIDIGQTEVSLLKGVCYTAFVLCTSALLDTSDRIQRFIFTIIITVSLQAFYAIFLQFSGFDTSPVFGYDITDRATGSFVYHNHLANYLLIGSSLTIGLLIGELKRNEKIKSFKQFMIDFLEALLSPKWLMRVAIITMVIALIMTRSRMGNSAFFISLLLTSLIALFFMYKPPRMLKWLIVSFVVIDVAIVGAMFGIDKVKERIDTTSFEGETRDDVVEMSIPLVEDSWLTGKGAGTFYTAFPEYHTRTIHLMYDHAHNEYLQFTIEYGLIPTLILGFAIGACLYTAFQALRTRRDPAMQGIAFGSIMGIIAMLMHISVDFPLQAPATALNFLALLTLSLVCYKNKKATK